VVLGVLAGGALAWVTRPKPIIESRAPGNLNVKRMKAAKEQYDLARLMTHDREQHWQAVEEYFPPEKSAENLLYSRLAKRGRANLYVADKRFGDALKLYENLASLTDEPDLQLSGLAGEAVVYHHLMQAEKDPQARDALEGEVIARLVQLRPEMNLDRRISAFLAQEVRALFEEYPGAD